jgi:phosphoribosyl 1,2-cyclic phosphodiesterase
MTSKTQVCVLASTSAGNCTVIWNNDVSILVDCGTGVSYTEDALASLRLSLLNLSAVFLTHCHSDHVNRYTLKKLAEYNVPVYCHAKVAKALKHTYPYLQDKKGPLVPFTEGIGQIAKINFTSFSVPHDSKGGCFGYSFHIGSHKISIATDIGYTEPEHVTHFADSDIIIIESNHDVTMLAESPRPQWLKDRIITTGHLSNDQCGTFIQTVLTASKKHPSAIVLAHISQECNTNAHAINSMKHILTKADKNHIRVVETHKEKTSVVVSACD